METKGNFVFLKKGLKTEGKNTMCQVWLNEGTMQSNHLEENKLLWGKFGIIKRPQKASIRILHNLITEARNLSIT